MDALETLAKQLGYSLADSDYIEPQEGILKGMRIVQTTLVSEHVIYVHPTTMGTILNNATKEGSPVMIIKKG